jgi:hypothetical protein
VVWAYCWRLGITWRSCSTSLTKEGRRLRQVGDGFGGLRLWCTTCLEGPVCDRKACPKWADGEPSHLSNSRWDGGVAGCGRRISDRQVQNPRYVLSSSHPRSRLSDLQRAARPLPEARSHRHYPLTRIILACTPYRASRRPSRGGGGKGMARGGRTSSWHACLVPS